MPLPEMAEHFESSLFVALDAYNFRAVGEHRYVVHADDAGPRIVVTPETLASVEVILTSGGTGTFQICKGPHGCVAFKVDAA